ncbi:MAG: hypothetical protein WCJ71_00610 [Candidatus Omnitrophota bacterium]
MDEDLKRLSLFSKLHYVMGGLIALFSCFPIVHVVLGIIILTGKLPVSGGGTPPPAFVGLLFLVLGSIFILLGWGTAFCVILAGRKLGQCKNWTFCVVMAGIQCMMVPFGTLLGVFTILTLVKDPVKQMFSGNSPSA